jgi:hypothetical protein
MLRSIARIMMFFPDGCRPFLHPSFIRHAFCCAENWSIMQADLKRRMRETSFVAGKMMLRAEEPDRAVPPTEAGLTASHLGYLDAIQPQWMGSCLARTLLRPPEIASMAPRSRHLIEQGAPTHEGT